MLHNGMLHNGTLPHGTVTKWYAVTIRYTVKKQYGIEQYFIVKEQYHNGLVALYVKPNSTYS